MASTALPLYVFDLDSIDSRKQKVLWLKADEEITSGDYVWFQVGFKNKDKGVDYKTLKDSEGNTVQITALDSYVTMDFNFYNIKAFYEGEVANIPGGLEVYQS